MDMIVDRLSEIEHAAACIVDAASEEKTELAAASKKRIEQMDAEIELDTENKLEVLKKTLDEQMNQELSELRESTKKNITMIEMDYEANHGKLADEILNKMIKR